VRFGTHVPHRRPRRPASCYACTPHRRNARVLIDCGVFMGTPGGSQRMQEIAENIRSETSGVLDVLVASHEHWDHLSGFYYAAEIFRSSRFVRPGWAGRISPMTRPPGLATGSPGAKEGRRELGERLTAAQDRVAPTCRNSSTSMAPAITGRTDLSDVCLTGGQRICGPRKHPKFSARSGRECDLPPGGTPLTLEGLDGLRIYVLGPPTDPGRIGKSAPSAGQVYGLAAESFLSGAHAATRLGWMQTR